MCWNVLSKFDVFYIVSELILKPEASPAPRSSDSVKFLFMRFHEYTRDRYVQ